MYYVGKNLQIKSVISYEDGGCRINVTYWAGDISSEVRGSDLSQTFFEALLKILEQTPKVKYVQQLQLIGSDKKEICKNVDKQLEALINQKPIEKERMVAV